MKKILSVVVLCAVALSAAAIPARRGGIVKTAADGTEKTVFLHGDAFFHYVTDVEGNWLDEESFLPLSAEVKASREKAGMARLQARRESEARRVSGKLNLAPRGLLILVNFRDKSSRHALCTAGLNVSTKTRFISIALAS